MRVFAALDLPPGAKEAIGAWQEGIKRLHGGLRWVDPRLCHVTLRFLGAVGRDAVDALSRILFSWTPGVLPFTLDSAGVFGGEGRPAVYWIGGSFPAGIADLVLRLNEVPDDRGRVHRGGFTPHITVARSRAEDGRARLSDPPRVRGFIETASILDSLLTSRGPEYSTVRRFDLSATDGAADGQSDGR